MVSVYDFLYYEGTVLNVRLMEVGPMQKWLTFSFNERNVSLVIGRWRFAAEKYATFFAGAGKATRNVLRRTYDDVIV